MPDIPAGHALIAHGIRLVGDLEPMITTLGVKLNTAVIGELEDLTNDLFGFFKTAWLGELNNFYALTGVTAYANFAGERIVVASDTPEAVCTVVDPALPQNCAFLVKKRTAFGGRQNRGRMYIPGCPQESVDASGVLTAGKVASIAGKLNTWLDAINGHAHVDTAVVLHGPGTFSPTPTPITSLTVDARIATQRRRLR